MSRPRCDGDCVPCTYDGKECGTYPTTAPVEHGQPAGAIEATAAPEFKREDRYLVLKRREIRNALTELEQHLLSCIAAKVHQYRTHLMEKNPLHYVVVESDWPEYEPTWDAIQRRMEGRPTRELELQAEVERLTVVLQRMTEADPAMLGENDVCDVCCDFRETAKEALVKATQPSDTCESCHSPLGDDAPLYEDADICRPCHEEIRAAETVRQGCPHEDGNGWCLNPDVDGACEDQLPTESGNTACGRTL